MNTLPSRLVFFVRRNPLLFTVVLGSASMCAWALLRFFTYPSTFDLVGQQLLARQLLHGGMQGAIVGPTNYVLKLFFIYIPFSWLHLSPRLSLILMTLLVNVATFILVSVLLRKIAVQLGLKVNAYFYAGLLWFACIGGSIFWVQFTNFRNLEFAGGLYFIYLGLHFYKSREPKNVLWLASFAALLFFADPLQVYMTALPLLVFLALRTRRDRTSWRPWSHLLAAIIAGVIGSKCISLVVEHVFGLVFLQSGSMLQAVHSVVASPFAAAKGWAANNLRLFAGGPDMGRARQAADIGVLAVLVACWLANLRRVRTVATGFIAVMAIAIELVYITSGQSLQGDTSRYLMMLTPLMVLLVAGLRRRRWLDGLLGIAIVASIVLLGSTLLRQWDTSFPHDAHLAATTAFADTLQYDFVVTSMDTAIPATYYYRPHTPLLPVACNGSLIRQTLYYSGAAYDRAVHEPAGLAAVIMDGSTINTYPLACNEHNVVTQFGQPAYISQTADGSVVFAYPAQQLAKNLR